MHRRTVLSTAAVLLSGCVAPGDGASNTPRSIETTGEEPTGTPHENQRPYELVPANPASLSSSEVREQMSARDCAKLADSTAICPDDDARLAVSRSRAVESLPRGTVELVVRNDADERFTWNPYDWRLLKCDGNAWRHIAPLSIPGKLSGIQAGEAHAFRVSVDNTKFHGTDSYVTTDEVTLSGLGPGAYGFAVDGHFESTPDDSLAAVALFGFAGEGPVVRPTDNVADVERNESELVVSTDSGGERRRALVVSFVDDDPDVRLLPEHVLQVAGLRNTLSYAATDNVDAIRYGAGENAVETAARYLDAVASDAERYGFREYVFEVSNEAV